MRNIQLPKQIFNPITLGIFAVIATGCGGGKDTSPPVTGEEIAVVATSLFRSATEGGPLGAHAAISVTDFSKQEQILPTDKTDLGLSSHGSTFYRIERYNYDNITKFDATDPSKVIWNYKTLDDGDTATSNPYALLTVSDQKAYVLRNTKTKAWIVNPSAVTQSAFKMGDIDFGNYGSGTASDAPEMAAGTIVGSKLFVAIQNLDSAYAPQDAYVAVVDTTTDIEIDTDPAVVSGKLGIKLPVKNPQDMTYSPVTNLLYVAGTGRYGYGARLPEYTGGIATVDPVTFETRVLVDDGDATTHPYGNIEKVVVVDERVGYFVGYHDWQNNAVYKFNPITGTVGTTSLISGQGIGCLGVDSKKRLWVCVSPGASDPEGTKPSMKVYDTSTNELVRSIELSLKPIGIVFVTRPQ